MLVDANLLLYAVDASSRIHDPAARWLEEVLNADRRVAFPWQTLGAFLRISTHPRVASEPLTPEQAAGFVRRWLEAEQSWVPPASERTVSLLSELIERHGVTANLVPDAQLAAIALEHGLTIYSMDSDFARFPEVGWVNPLA